ncbi:response regulator transcription factor [Corynebacterium incognita]|uniref:Response regulator transcription factor n=1 Tax=Corynebacterium incognita TaxID=2754725 RepID=A0A7G7CM45_9CORY|nr:response regulator transcription factor [Corynebacterium incognita]QNE88661.1 response regulator transcription factor [Corynebacterium incognita]
MTPLTVALVDDEEALRKGIKIILDGTDDVTVVAEASNGKDAVEVISRARPDIVLMDIRMPVMDGIAATAALHTIDKDLPIIMLTAFDTDTFIVDALRAGAVGFLLKSTGPEALVSAIRAAAAGQQMLSPDVVSNLLALARPVDPARQDAPTTPATDRIQPDQLAYLSPREREIAQLIAQGLDNTAIAESLFISTTTVKTHVKNILHKIGGSNRVHIAIAVLGGARHGKNLLL